MGRDLALSLGGTEKVFTDQIFSNDLFQGKNSILTPKISDDLFSQRPFFCCLLPVSAI